MVYDGTGSSVTVTGIDAFNIMVFVFEYNGTGSDNNYNISPLREIRPRY